jgi:hypothetical protein
MASSSKDEDLLPEQTEGFKVGEKKTIDEYHKLGMLYLLSIVCGIHLACRRFYSYNILLSLSYVFLSCTWEN